MGELGDRVEAYRYTQYIKSCERAQLARWILSGSRFVENLPSVEDMVGVWDDGEILNKMDFYKKTKERIINKS